MTNENELLIYGSYGYTGALIAEQAAAAGLSPTLAGRRAERVERQATDLGLDHRVFSLGHERVVEGQVGEFDAVLNCAGPFSATAEPLYSACIEAGTDYLDIAGEIDVLEEISARGGDAEDAGVTLLPAVGFDVVPTDCLAAHLSGRVEEPTHLTLALDGLGTFSPGTLKSIVEGFGRSGAIRENGAIRSVPAAWRTRRLDFGDGSKPAVTVPWGDVATAHYATGIPNIEVYAAVPERVPAVMRRTRALVPLLGSKPVRAGLEALIDATVSGPTAEERAQSTTRIWGEVRNEDGDRAVARLRTPDTYDVTARTAVEAAARVLDGEVDDGFRTPAAAFGPEFITEFDGVELEDLADERTVAAGTGSGP